MQRLAIIVLAALVAVGCGGGDDDDSPGSARRPGSSTTSASTSSTTTVESEVEAAYDRYSEMFQRLLAQPNPDDPEIRERAVGEAADALIDNLTTLRALDRRVRFGSSYRYELVSIDVSGREAVAQECIVDDAVVINASSGEPIEPTPVATVLNAVTLTLDDRWRVSRIEQVDGWEGVAGCAA